MGRASRIEDGWSALKILTGKPTGKRPLGRPRHRWEDNIRMELKEIGFNTRNWIDSDQDRDYLRALANGTLNFRIPQGMELVNILMNHWFWTFQWENRSPEAFRLNLKHFINEFWLILRLKVVIILLYCRRWIILTENYKNQEIDAIWN